MYYVCYRYFHLIQNIPGIYHECSKQININRGDDISSTYLENYQLYLRIQNLYYLNITYAINLVGLKP